MPNGDLMDVKGFTLQTGGNNLVCAGQHVRFLKRDDEVFGGKAWRAR